MILNKSMNRRFSFFIAIFCCLSLITPVYANSDTDSEYTQQSTFWHWYAGAGKSLNEFIGYTFGYVCAVSEDGYHHASSTLGVHKNLLQGETPYYDCICTYCGKDFTAYASDLEQSYENQVEEMKKGKKPTQVTSNGKLLWQPTIHDVLITSVVAPNGNIFEMSSIPWVSPDKIFIVEFNETSNGLLSRFHPTSANSSASSGYRFSYVTVPVSGVYGVTPSTLYVASCVTVDGAILKDEGYYSEGTFVHSDVNAHISLSIPRISLFSFYTGKYSSFVCNTFFPVYEIIPDTAIDITSTGGTYSTSTRPTSTTGNYGIIGDNGQITQVTDNSSIVNETTNQFFNPATGESATISDWTYNYEDRSYTVTTETGDTVTVTYGDENITIVQGGDTYNIYYMVPGGSGTPGPDSCAHNWQETDKTEPTCVTAGKTVSTCSLCGKTKTDPLPATGHTWVVERTVQTSYDDEGNLLQQGYTIYQCSVCGEQYKDTQSTGPPGGTEEDKSLWEQLGDLIGSGIGGILELAGAILGKILDALTSLVEMITDKLKGIVEGILAIFDELPALFGGFLDFLGALFPYLPEEIMTLLTFGVIAIVFIGILKAVRR